MTSELGVQWETTSKLQLELDKQRREDGDVRRELIQKQAHIDELKKEMQSKTGNYIYQHNINRNSKLYQFSYVLLKDNL